LTLTLLPDPTNSAQILWPLACSKDLKRSLKPLPDDLYTSLSWSMGFLLTALTLKWLPTLRAAEKGLFGSLKAVRVGVGLGYWVSCVSCWLFSKQRSGCWFLRSLSWWGNRKGMFCPVVPKRLCFGRWTEMLRSLWGLSRCS